MQDTKWVATDIATCNQILKNENTSQMQPYNKYDDDYDYDGCNNCQNISHKKEMDANDNDDDKYANDGNNNDANDHKDDDDDDKNSNEDINGTSTTVDPPTSCTLHEMQHLVTYFNPVATNYVT